MQNNTIRRFTTYQMSVTALMAAVMCILGPLSIPIGPVPITLTNLVIFFSVFLLGTHLGTVSCVVYLILGAVGLPVFSGYAGGLAKLAGPTGGYLIGFIPMALISGFFIQHFHGRILFSAVGMLCGTAALYAIGTAWFVFLMQCSVVYALSVCVLPFLAGDIIKILLACVLGTMLRRRLIAANLLTGA